MQIPNCPQQKTTNNICALETTWLAKPMLIGC